MSSCVQTSAHLTVAAEIFYSDLILNPTIHVKHIETSSICYFLPKCVHMWFIVSLLEANLLNLFLSLLPTAV